MLTKLEDNPMIARYRYSLLLFTATFFAVGCAQTINPYLMLPGAPLEQDEVQLQAGVAGMPAVSTFWPGVNAGELVLIRYGVSDKLSLQMSTWTNSTPGFSPVGFSLQGIALLSPRTQPWRFALVPTLSVMNSGIQLNGWGTGLALATWTPTVLGAHPYLGLGALAGAASNNNNGYDVGFGGTADAGFEYDLFDHLSLSAECSVPVIVIREGPGSYYTNSFGVWGLTAGWHF
jgi:hypothetical protein